MRSARGFCLAGLAILACGALAVPAAADVRWQTDGVPVCTQTGNQDGPKIVSDGAQGAVIAWADRRGADYNIYAQRINSDGAVLASGAWNANPTGVPVCRLAGDDVGPTLIRSYNAGVPDGFIVVWHHRPVAAGTDEWDLVAQKLDANGNALWTYDGNTVCAAAGAQLVSHISYDGATGHFYVTGEGFRVVSDNAGGAELVWEDYRAATWDTTVPGNEHWMGIDIYGQHLKADGTFDWPGGTSGLAIQAQDGWDHANATVAPLGSSDVMVTWEDNRNGGSSGMDIYARRVTSKGLFPWSYAAVTVCAAPLEQWSPVIAADGSGGGIVVWRDHRNSGTTGWDLYAQRISGMGAALWAANGAAVCRAAGDQTDKYVITDGAGGIITAWVDLRDNGTTGWDLYAQRLNGSGSAAWTLNGVPVCTAAGNQADLQLYPDPAQGLLVVWEDYRTPANAPDIYAQRIGSDGTFKWALDGEAVCTAAGEQSYPFISDGPFDGAIIAWQDRRGADFDIYAQSVNLPPWELSALDPNTAVCGTAISVTLTGTAFLSHLPDRVFLNRSGSSNVLATGLQIVNDTTLWCNFSLATAPGGRWNVSVAQGNTTSTLAGALAVHVRLDSFNPPQAFAGSTVIWIVSGLGFSSGTTARVFSGAAELLAQQVVATAVTLQGRFYATGAETGLWDLEVTDRDGVQTGLSQVLQWIPATPTATPVATATAGPPRYDGGLAFFPNPAARRVKLEITAPEDGKVFLNLYNAAGERVLRWEGPVTIGRNEATLEFEGLARGIYLARPEFQGATRSEKWQAKKLAVVR